MKRLHSISALILLFLFAAQAVGVPEAFAAESRVLLAGHVPMQVQSATFVDQVAADESVGLSLMVNVDQNQLNQLLEQMYGRNATRKRQYLSASEFAQDFGIAEKRRRIKAFATANGLTVNAAEENPNSLIVKVTAPAHAVEQAFQVQLNHFRGADNQVFRASQSNPSIPASLAPHLSAVLGLSNLTGQRHPHYRVAVPQAGQPHALAGSGPSNGLAPADIRKVNAMTTTTLTGSGQSVALFELDGYTASDISAYAAQFGIHNPTLTNVPVDGPVLSCGSGCTEVALDIELVAAIATGLTQILVYEGPNSDQGVIDTYNKIATDNIASSVSTSWGLAEDESAPSVISSENTIFSRMAVQGQSIYAASGDCGAYDDGSTLGVDDPASQPFMTGVGGSSLSGTLSSFTQSAWSGPADSRCPRGTGGGGGISSQWSIPSYQAGVSGTASQTFRNVPDISLDADPNSGYSIYVSGVWGVVGGTSAAAPLWAAMTALVNQQRIATSNGAFGFANPTIYQLAQSSSYGTVLSDINDNSTNLYYHAITGYDDATGWGTYLGDAFISAVTVVLPPVITAQPASRFVSVGQPATFSVGATGVGLTYQWLKGGTAIANAAQASYSTPPVIASNDGTQYSCQVTNAGGTVTTNPATLSVGENNDLGHVLIYPNPWDTRKHTGTPLHFSGLPDGSTIKIFTLSAHWVRTLTPSGGHADWDLTNDSGQAVASGYYLYFITDVQGQKINGKLAVIR